MITGKTHGSNTKAPKMTSFLDNRRKEMGISVSEFAGLIGLNRDSYRRRVNSGDGFSELELVWAAKILGYDILLKQEVIGEIVVGKVEVPIEKVSSSKGWRDKIKL